MRDQISQAIKEAMKAGDKQTCYLATHLGGHQGSRHCSPG